MYGLVIGALLPIPFWLWQRKYPRSVLRHFNISVFLCGATYAPPATGVNYTSYFIVAFLFREWMPCARDVYSIHSDNKIYGSEYLLRVRRRRLRARFNYVLAAALEAGKCHSIGVRGATKYN